MSNQIIKIDGTYIGKGHPPYVIAELSANHNGSLERALKTLEAIKSSGANAVKLQTYTPDTMTINCQKEDFIVKGGLWDGYSLYDLYKWAQTPFEWQKVLFDKARQLDMTCFSTPFDETAVDLLEDLNTPAYKIASFEANDLPLIKKVSETGKPVILSTGMANLEEISEAVQTARDNGCKELALLHCISSYPAPVDQSNLKTLVDMAARFNTVVGLSDHTIGNTTAITSVALGASIIEKHVTLDRKEKGPDSEFSLEPDELSHLCQSAKDAWAALGCSGYETKPAEVNSIKFRRSLYVVKDISAGEKLSEDNIRRIRPGFGLAPKHFFSIIGKTVKIDIKAGTALAWSLIDND